MAAMHERVLAEDVADRAAQRLGAVDHEQDRLLGIEAAVDEIGEQRAGERGVLGRPFPQPERDLDALGGDPERDDVAAVGDLDAVKHHHRQANIIEAARHQLLQRGRGALDEDLRHRGLRPRGARALDAQADGLADRRELPGRDAGEHAVHHRARERVAVGEVRIRLDGQLASVVGRAHPGPAHLHASAAERHRPVLVAVTLGPAVRVVLALRAHDLGHLELHQLVHDAQPDTDAQRKQALPRRSDELTERLLNFRWQRAPRRIHGRADLRRRYLPHGGSSRPLGLG
jgi:hypothetical protein